MFAKDKVSQSMIDAVNSVLMEKKMHDVELDETGLRKAAWAAHKSGQTHFEFQGKKYPVKVQGENVMAGESVDEASVKVNTKTGTMVYGGAKGGSAKAYLQQKYGDDLADVHGPSDKDLEAIKHEKKKKKEVDEDFNIEDFSLEEIQEFMQTEDYEQLDELSKDTLKRYIPTAAADLSKKGINAGIDAKSGKTGVTKAYGDHFQKRYRGILKATNKLAKEEVDEDFDIEESINDNLHPAGALLLKHIKPEHHNKYKAHLTTDTFNGSYKDRTDVLNAAKKSGHLKSGVDLDEGKMGQLSADLKDMSHADFTKEYGKPKHHYDPSNFKKPVQPGKEMDRAKSLAQRAMASMKKEEVEELDELNKDTLYSYVKKSEKDQDNQFNKVSKGIRDNDPKSANKAGHKFSMRSVGQGRAENRLAKEEVEELDEAEGVKYHLHFAGNHPNAGMRVNKTVYTSRQKAERAADKLDNSYGAVAHVPKRVQEDTSFAYRLLQSIREGKGREAETFTDNNPEGSGPTVATLKGPVPVPKKIFNRTGPDVKVPLTKEDTTPPFAGPYTKSKGTVTDKSGAKHTPMSRVKDLARQSMKKVKNETLMGTAGATSESVEELDEDAMLDVYLKSRGLNPANIPTDKKIAYAKGSDFLRWKQNHS